MSRNASTTDLLNAIDRADDLCEAAGAMDTNWRLGEAVELTRHVVAAFAHIDCLDSIGDEEHDGLDQISERAHDAITHSASKLSTATAWKDRMSKDELNAVQSAYRGVRILRAVWKVTIRQPGAEAKLADAMREA